MRDNTQRLDDEAFEAFAYLHPHEAYGLDPDRFWAYFQKRCPGTDRGTMVDMIFETPREPEAAE
jgi:hypothetical protein